MKNLKKLIIIAILSFVGASVFAQNSKFTANVNTGISTFILNTGYGLHLGTNAAYNLSNRFAVEGALAYQNINITNSFLSGEVAKEYCVNTMVGGRFYLNNADKTTRFHVNLLVGAGYYSEYKSIISALSTGLYATRGKLLVGIAAETPESIGIRIGYNL